MRPEYDRGMPSAGDSVNELAILLGEMERGARRLLDVIGEERKAVASLNMVTFEFVTKQKIELLEYLHGLEERRAQLAASLARHVAMSTERITIEELAARLDGDKSQVLTARARSLKAAVIAVQHANTSVAALAERSLVFLHEALMLAHRPTAAAGSLYSPSGIERRTMAQGGLLRQKG